MDNMKLNEKVNLHPLNVDKIREDFPILKQKMNGKPLAYLDNAATSQKPRTVIDSLVEYYENYNSNIHRSVHKLSEIATEKYEETRSLVAGFINAQSAKEIIFTKNATEGLNLVAYSLGATLKKGDEIISSVMEHHSNIVPWQMMVHSGIKVNYIDIDEEGKLRADQLEDMINENTKIVALTHTSNVLGTINDIKKLARISHDAGAIIVVDGAQSTPHMPVDVQDLDVDFFAFSPHKMLGPTGVGILYGKKSILEENQPFLLGGDMIKEVTLEKTTFNEIPFKFEAGTPNVADVIAFGSAIRYLSTLGMNHVRHHEKILTEHALERIGSIPGVNIYGPTDAQVKAGVIAFNIDGVHSHDVASILDSEGIAIRSGHSCAMPLMKRLGCSTVARASFYVYNTEEEVERLSDAIKKVKRVFDV